MSLSPDLVDEQSPVDNGTPAMGLRRRKNNQSRLAAVEKPSDQSQTAVTAASMAQPNGNGNGNVFGSFTQPVPVGPEGKSYVDSLMCGAMRPSQGSKVHNRAISTIDKHFRCFAMWNICAYATLVATVYVVVPNENIVRLDGVERNSAIMAMSLIAISFLSRITPLLGGFGKGNSQNNRSKLNISGIFIGGLTVQFVAFSTDFLMAFFPTPLLIDPVLGTRVHILRWCEWAPCAAYMTFMMEGADLYWPGEHPPPDYLRTKYLHALAQGGAVFLGLLFPFCPGYWSWMVCMIVSCCLYLTIFPRMRDRQRAIPATLRDGATVEEAERFNSSKISLRLRYATTIIWSTIVIFFFVSSILGPKYAPEGSFLGSPSANMVCECVLDVLSKVLFLVVIGEVHRAIFDPFARTERRLGELRQLMAAVWDSSSDVIAISVRGDDNVSTMLSPAFFGLGSSDGPLRNLSNEQIKDLHQRKSVLYQLSGDSFREKCGNSTNDVESRGPKVKPEMISNIEETGFSNMEMEPQTGRLAFEGGNVNRESGALRAVSDIVVKAWACEERELVFPHDLLWANEGGLDRDHLIRSEAKVSRLDDNALIVIVRDISERVKVFEAEKQILFETTSRQKDAEANRFTRHEVKNGLLSAIGLYESLCEAQRSQLMLSRSKTTTVGVGLNPGDTDISEDVVRCMNELGKSLNETLDTILIEAMTRDLIHDLYRPHRELINVSSVLSGFADEHSHSLNGVGNLTRFPLITRPSPLPMFYFDPHLLRYLHRQALSNACKYGKTGGVVLTEILYDEEQDKMQINVINLPGEFHHKLIAMGSEAEELVFEKSCQIHVTFQSDDSRVSKKSEAAALPGDGAWIIRKCAKIMKGKCTIKFEGSRTVFSLSIPANPLKPRGGRNKSPTRMDVRTFRLPDRIWGIAIDDSKIQMKLLGRYFEFAGIQKDRIKVFGKNADEIMGFVDYVVNFMDEKMGDPVLLIADENLDLTDEASKHITISGSQLVENIRSRLLPEQEKQLVALIRSANDSSSDVAIYNSRAHGFLPKAPIKKGNVLEALAPLWIARYPEVQTALEDDSQSRGSLANSVSSDSLVSYSSLNDFIVTTPIEIMQTVNQIDALFSKGSITENWNIIWEKLHILKGDLLTLQVSSKVISAVGMINSFRELRSNEDLMERWGLLRAHISHWLNSM